MYMYNLIVKKGDLDEPAARAMIEHQLIARFGDSVNFTVSAVLTNEVVAQVRWESKRGIQVTLGEWFNEGRVVEMVAGYPDGTLLHYREILPSEPLFSQLGG
jgi:hypothetical protein